MEEPRRSQGLRYLSRVRPEAMDHLLKFFAESARHLDPKTRFLISVVTKVISHSSRGLRQYVKRALEEGATPDEIVDAVLCAYPCAGLTRVVDAIDVILDMDLPGFDEATLTAVHERGLGEAESEAPPGQAVESDGPSAAVAGAAEARWHDVAGLDQVPAVGGLAVKIGERRLGLFRRGDGVAALDEICPHRGASLVDGTVIGDEVVCSLHRWKFRLSDGLCAARPRASIRAHETRVEAGRVLVKMS